VKPRKCKSCRNAFTPTRPMQSVCSIACSLALATKQRERKAAQDAREQRRSRREALDKVKTRGEHLREAQAAFNAWVRLRDAGQSCLACKRHHGGQYHAGHYRSVGSCPELRFEPDNVHMVCQPCNVHLSGNLIQMRLGMVEKIGLERVEWLEGPHEPKKLTVTEIQELKAKYRAKVRRLKKEAE